MLSNYIHYYAQLLNTRCENTILRRVAKIAFDSENILHILYTRKNNKLTCKRKRCKPHSSGQLNF